MTADGHLVRTGTVVGNFTTMSSSVLFVGGAPSHLSTSKPHLHHLLSSSANFTGCLRKVGQWKYLDSPDCIARTSAPANLFFIFSYLFINFILVYLLLLVLMYRGVARVSGAGGQQIPMAPLIYLKSLTSKKWKRSSHFLHDLFAFSYFVLLP